MAVNISIVGRWEDQSVLGRTSKIQRVGRGTTQLHLLIYSKHSNSKRITVAT
jgi:hypothetical protein